MNIPPVIPPQPDAGPIRRPVPRWGAVVMLVLLAGYVLYAGLHGASRADAGPALPTDPAGLVTATLLNLGIFAVLFAVGWLAARPSRADLYATKPFELLNVVLGFAWSLVLRAGIFVLAVGAIGIATVFHGSVDQESIAAFRPKVENLIGKDALANPVYVLLCTTWVSFVVAGLREELWRAGMIASLRALFPAEWPGRRWEWLAMVIAAVVFGLGHLTQGWAAVALTGVLGLGLGAILIVRRSLAEAVLAHGFFDACTFAALALVSNRAFLERFIQDPALRRQLNDLLPR